MQAKFLLLSKYFRLNYLDKLIIMGLSSLQGDFAMNALNKPVEMIAVCSPEGALSPARFRLTGEDGERITVRIRQIRKCEEIPYMGIETFRFVCTAVMGGRERAFELRYRVRDHRWVLWRFLDTAGS